MCSPSECAAVALTCVSQLSFENNTPFNLRHMLLRRCSSLAVKRSWGEPAVREVKPPRVITIKDVVDLAPSDEPIQIKGWVRNLRKMQHHAFLVITDNMDRNYQVVLPRNEFDFHDVKMNIGSSVSCVGTIKQSGQSNDGPSTELQCRSLSLLGDAPVELMPFREKMKTTLEWPKLRQHIHLRPRVSKVSSMLRVRSHLITSVYKYMEQEEYYNVTTPVLTSNDCEGGGNAFTVKSPICTEKEPFFNKDIYLTVSAQLHLEAMASAMNKVFTMAPAFRAENSQTRRHLAEFTMLEGEESFLDSLDVLMDRVEHLTKSLANSVMAGCANDLEYLHKVNEKYTDYSRILHSKFLRLTYDEAVELVNKNQDIETLKHGEDIGTYHEKVLLDYFEGIPLFITHYPATLKPFYMKREGDRALCFDLIVRNGGELCGGSLREDSYDQLRSRIETIGRLESFQWYLDLRQIGGVPHGGYGLGIERLIQTLTGIQNVKDAIPFPRWCHHCPL